MFSWLLGGGQAIPYDIGPEVEGYAGCTIWKLFTGKDKKVRRGTGRNGKGRGVRTTPPPPAPRSQRAPAARLSPFPALAGRRARLDLRVPALGGPHRGREGRRAQCAQALQDDQTPVRARGRRAAPRPRAGAQLGGAQRGTRALSGGPRHCAARPSVLAGAHRPRRRPARLRRPARAPPRRRVTRSYALRFLDGLESEDAKAGSTVYIVTEPVTPLALLLKDGPLPEPAIAWGLRCVASCLAFLHKGGLMHANVQLVRAPCARALVWAVVKRPLGSRSHSPRTAAPLPACIF